ncbi:hypothetical protein [Psychromonas sp. MME2]|uniref:hypothetical protein n=1 Tax=unclassified Psychromonas TaxID=2614957 RepID=UPI00339C647E
MKKFLVVFISMNMLASIAYSDEYNNESEENIATLEQQEYLDEGVEQEEIIDQQPAEQEEYIDEVAERDEYADEQPVEQEEYSEEAAEQEEFIEQDVEEQ